MADVIGIDFAPRFSAYAVLDSETAELKDFGVVDAHAEAEGFNANIVNLSKWAQELNETYEDAHIVMEDVSHFMTNPAHGLRLQGAFRAFLWQHAFDNIEMVYPQTWQKFFGWKKTVGTTSKGFATFACGALGYTDLGLRGKSKEDVHDAILIARWKIESVKRLAPVLE